ncbi:ATP-binding protein [Kitasatospora sp. NPDC048194]|uniref:ATP-binding protein n=1 Tax=Kitasatospora sp. NPDC048194 TaxID=3364045 RepID=UPI00371FAA9B
MSFAGQVEMPVACGRDFVRRALARWHLPGPGPGAKPALLDDVLLVTAELLANACLHGGGPRELALERRPGVLRVEVADASAARPRRLTPASGSPGGYGLLIVERLAARWGTTVRAGGKTVWAELATTGR